MSYESFVLVELEAQYFLEAFGLTESTGVYATDNMNYDIINGRSIDCILEYGGTVFE